MDDVKEEFKLFQHTSLDDGIISRRAYEAFREMNVMATGGGKLFAVLSSVMLGVHAIFQSSAVM